MSLSKGSVAGIVVAAVILALAVIFIILKLIKKKYNPSILEKIPLLGGNVVQTFNHLLMCDDKVFSPTNDDIIITYDTYKYTIPLYERFLVNKGLNEFFPRFFRHWSGPQLGAYKNEYVRESFEDSKYNYRYLLIKFENYNLILYGTEEKIDGVLGSGNFNYVIGIVKSSVDVKPGTAVYLIKVN